MHDIESVSTDTQVLLLLCGSLGQNRAGDTKPLTPTEYYQLAQWLKQNNIDPPDLLLPQGLRMLQDVPHPKLDSGRIITLLERGGTLALALEEWHSRGIWVLSRYDDNYPKRLAERLGRSAPLLLYGVGSVELMSAGGMAVVGSRNVDNEGLEFTCRIAQACADEGIQVISGAARGVDAEAMMATLESGGRVVGVVADSLVRTAVSSRFRRGILDENLLLVSSYDPNAGFSVGSAMGRNKYIYALSDWAVVVATTSGTGGTWSGAVENLKNRWTPLFVRSDDQMPDGNRHLIDNGGIPISREVFNNGRLNDWLNNRNTSTQHSGQLSLLD